MTTRDLGAHIVLNGCSLVREDGNHSWWENRQLNKRSAIPRHTEISDTLAKKICKDLGVEPPRR
jgi:mRNA interferase HicA